MKGKERKETGGAVITPGSSELAAKECARAVAFCLLLGGLELTELAASRALQTVVLESRLYFAVATLSSQGLQLNVLTGTGFPDIERALCSGTYTQ
jgi:hypothetical protein